MTAAIPGFPPWDFMLAVDAINYDVDQQVAVAHRSVGRILNLSSGINLLRPPAYVLDIGAQAITNEGFFHDYDGPAGHEIGRRGVASYERCRSDGRSVVTAKNILITTGASTALQAAATVLRHRLGPGEAVIPEPTYPLVGELLHQAGFRIHEVVGNLRSDKRWLPEVDQVVEAMGPHTRILYVNQFNNPTGEVYSSQELRILIAACRRREVTLVVDRVSANLDFSSRVPDVLAVVEDEDYLDRSCLVSSLSKERCVPGLRIGWLIAGADFIAATERVTGGPAPSSSSPSSAIAHVDLAIRAVAHAHDAGGRIADVLPDVASRFLGPLEELACLAPAGIELMRAQYDALLFARRVEEYMAWRQSLRDTLTANWALLENEHGHTVQPGPRPMGGFNALVQIPGLRRCDPLLTTHQMFLDTGLQILPGPAFGSTPKEWRDRDGFWTRLSFAMPQHEWAEGLERLASYVQSLAASQHRIGQH
jgi:aspartate/methionine/tyrosine aminotransferase